MRKNIINFLLLTALIIGSLGTVFGVEMVTPKLNPPMPLPELPIIDGSSSTVAMHGAIKAYLTDEYFLLEHSKTYAALWRLAPERGDIVVVDGKSYRRFDDNPPINPELASHMVPATKLPDGLWGWGREVSPTTNIVYPRPADVLLSVKYYDSALEEAEKYGADLVITPIAKEGFVFMVHADNPIESLTQEQIKGIFSGKITNWKEVGGNDEGIITYQRNSDSGSQTAMVDFMDGVPLTATPFYNPISVSSMSGMISDVRKNKNSIGYNIYSWSLREALELLTLKTEPSWYMSLDMGPETQNKGIKLIAVDGIMPSDETLASDTYPLRVYTYSYYNKSNEKGKALTDWLLTEEGQKVIAGGGYVGIFGEMPPNELIDLDRDYTNAKKLIDEFYKEENYNEIVYRYSYTDTAKMEELAGDKAKDKTFLYHVTGIKRSKRESSYGYSQEYTYRFIVLTRENGATEFEVINEGEYGIIPFSF